MSPASTKSRQTRGLLGLGPQAVPQTDGININWPLGLLPDSTTPSLEGVIPMHPEPLLGENPCSGA